MIRVALPAHLRTLAKSGVEVTVEVEGAATIRAVLDALEAKYPVLSGTIRDHVTQQRRPFLRFFVCGEDWSHETPDAELPEAVGTGKEPFFVIGAIAGGVRELAAVEEEQPIVAAGDRSPGSTSCGFCLGHSQPTLSPTGISHHSRRAMTREPTRLRDRVLR